MQNNTTQDTLYDQMKAYGIPLKIVAQRTGFSYEYCRLIVKEGTRYNRKVIDAAELLVDRAKLLYSPMN